MPARRGLTTVTRTVLSALALPKAAVLTDALVAPAGPPLPPTALAELRRALSGSIAEGGAGRAGRVRVDAYALRARWPADASDARPFAWSPATARRSTSRDRYGP